MFTRPERSPNVSYLYSVPVNQDNGISWHDSLEFTGVYDSLHSALYLTDGALYAIKKSQYPIVEKVVPSMAEDIRSRVDRRVEDMISNDRKNLPIQEITDGPALRELKHYREYSAKEDAIRQ